MLIKNVMASTVGLACHSLLVFPIFRPKNLVDEVVNQKHYVHG